MMELMSMSFTQTERKVRLGKNITVFIELIMNERDGNRTLLRLTQFWTP